MSYEADNAITPPDERENLIALDALGVASESERQQLQSLLSSETQASSEIKLLARELRDSAAMLAFSTERIEPSPETRARLLDSIKVESANNNPPPTLAASSTVSAEALSAQTSNVVSLEGYRAQRSDSYELRRSTVHLTAVAASVALLLFAGLAYYFYQRNTTANAELARWQSEAARLAGSNQQLSTELARSRTDAELIAAPQTRLATLSGTAKAPAASARLVFDPTTRRAVIFLDQLPLAPAGKAYQLWYIADGKPLPGIVFTVDDNNTVTLRDEAPRGSSDASIFAVTLEQSGGSTTPTGDKILVGNSL